MGTTNKTSKTPSKQAREIKRQQLRELTAKIKDLLSSDPRYRENDALLMNRIQMDELIASGYDFDKVTVGEFFIIRLQKKVSSGDSITRIRREVQEYYPETRGENYKKRQSQQVDVIEDLHDVEDGIVKDLLETQKQSQVSDQDQKNNESIQLTTKNEEQADPVLDICEHCQGTGKYEYYPCNICNGTGHEVHFKD